MDDVAPDVTPPLPITVTGADRLNRREQLEQIFTRARERAKDGILRVRLPLSIFDYTDQRTHVYIRDAAWNLQLPLEHTTPDDIEQLIKVIGVCLTAVAREGAEKVKERLERP